jgi:hypothetical protein
MWLPTERRILVGSRLNREVAWQIGLHEMTHSFLDDSGVKLPTVKEEAVCDAVAAGMLRLLRSLTHEQKP